MAVSSAAGARGHCTLKRLTGEHVIHDNTEREHTNLLDFNTCAAETSCIKGTDTLMVFITFVTLPISHGAGDAQIGAVRIKHLPG